MRVGVASQTARNVAAVRAGVSRAIAPYGDPEADDRLQRLVAGSVRGSATPMSRYLEARTRWVDRVVVAALDTGVEQVIVAAAGYDGRSVRYAKPEVRWFEVDHPATQGDKRARLAELGIRTDQIAFVPADFTTDDVAVGLSGAGCDAGRRSLVVAEGIAVYLDRSVLASLLTALRRSVAEGSQLAISLSVAADSPQQSERRVAFRARVAEMGEPALTVLTAADADELLTAAGWQPRQHPDPESGERARWAGFVIATAIAKPT